MDFQLNEEQKALKQAAYQFAKKKLEPNAFTWEEKGWPWENAKMLSATGYLGMTLPEEYGGGGMPLINGIIVMEEITKVCPHSADIVQAANFGPIRAIALLAGDTIKRKVLPAVISGKHTISLGMTEPDAGSALTDLRTRAILDREGKDYILNGSKMFTGHSDVSTFFVVYTRFGEGNRTQDIGSIVVEKGTSGFTQGKVETYMSGAHYSGLYFDDCRVPVENVVTTNFNKMINAMNVERCGNATRCVGVAQGAFDRAFQYSQERTQFGKDLCEFQGIQWMFAEMAVKIEAARLLVYRAVVNEDKGFTNPLESSMAKLFANQMAQEVTSTALQILGGYGYSKEFPLEYLFRRARGWSIGGGTIEMQKNRIASLLFKRKFSQRPPKKTESL